MPVKKGVALLTRCLGGGVALTALVGVTTLVWTPSAGADATGYYAGNARAVFVTGYFSNPSIPGGVRPEGGGPQTDASQTSLSRGDANASFPYFGDVVPTAPGVVSGLFGFPVPPYPLTASSTYGSAPGAANYPGVTLSAVSRASSTVADAVVGTAGAGAAAHSEVEQAGDGAVRSAAAASSPLTTLGPLVSLKGVDSVVRVSAAPDGLLTRSSNFSIDQIEVPGLVLRIPEQTPGSYPIPVPFAIPGVPAPQPIPAPPIPIPAGGQTITQPRIGFVNGVFTISLPFAGKTQEYALPAQPVLDAFRAQGVALNYTSPRETKDGLIGGVFTVEYTLPPPPPNDYYHGATPATFVIGAAQAAVNRGGSSTQATAGAGLPPAPGSPANTLPPGIAPAAPAPPSGGAALPAVAPGGSGAPPTVAFDPSLGHRGGAARLLSAALPAFVGSNFSAIYLGLLALALAAFVGVSVLLVKGRSRWTS